MKKKKYKQLSDYKPENNNVERNLIKLYIDNPKGLSDFLKLIPIKCIGNIVGFRK